MAHHTTAPPAPPPIAPPRVRPGSSPLPDADRTRLKALHDALGLQETARRLDIYRDTILRAIAGAGLREGSHMLIRARLDLADVRGAETPSRGEALPPGGAPRG